MIIKSELIQAGYGLDVHHEGVHITEHSFKFQKTQILMEIVMTQVKKFSIVSFLISRSSQENLVKVPLQASLFGILQPKACKPLKKVELELVEVLRFGHMYLPLF